MANLKRSRESMVAQQIAGRGIRDERVLRAMLDVPREIFVPSMYAADAYSDCPLPIGYGQTISQPYIVALMVQALELQGEERVLEAGAGSGYAAAILARLVGQVIAIERIPELAALAERNLARAGITNVRVYQGDGSLGWPREAPYDAILVSAGTPIIPEALERQLTEGGRLIVPVGAQMRGQTLCRVTRDGAGGIKVQGLGAVQFVPLIGAGGWEKA